MKNKKDTGKKTVAIFFWLCVWQIVSVIMKDSLVFVGPADMLRSLWEQMHGMEFWISIGNSALRIMAGFLAAFGSAVAMAGITFRVKWLKLLLDPVVQLAKSVPVASFVVLLLILAGSEKLSV